MACDAKRRAKRASTFLLLATSLRKFKSLIQKFKRALDLTKREGIGTTANGEVLQGLSNLIVSNDFRILKIKVFKIVLKTCEFDLNGVKMAIFYEKT